MANQEKKSEPQKAEQSSKINQDPSKTKQDQARPEQDPTICDANNAKAAKVCDPKELTDSLQRLQADFENYKKRVEKDKEAAAKFAQGKILQQLLPVMDTFELALKSMGDHKQFVKGVEMIYAELASLLKNQGVSAIPAIGKQCNPNLHDVLLQETRKDVPDDTITEELQKGYLFRDMLLRTSKVKIAKRGTDDHKTDSTEHHS